MNLYSLSEVRGKDNMEMGGGAWMGFVGLFGSADHGRWTRRTADVFLGGDEAGGG